MYSVETYYILQDGFKNPIDTTEIVKQLMNLADSYNGEWTAGGQGAENLLPWKRIIKCFNNFYFYDVDELYKFLLSLQNTDIKIEFIRHYYSDNFENYLEIFNKYNNEQYYGDEYKPDNKYMEEEKKITDIFNNI